MISETYRVTCEDFEGPLDLLLYLVRKQEVNIIDLSISRITGEYLKFISDLEDIDFDGAGEFLRYASTLLSIKAREMIGEEEESEDREFETRRDLVRRLEEFKMFKEKSEWFRNKLKMANMTYSRPPADISKEVRADKYKLKEILSSIKREEPFNPPTTILFHIEHLIDKLKKGLKELSKFVFSKFVEGQDTSELVGMFFALLEVIRKGDARAIQKKPFGEIWIEKR